MPTCIVNGCGNYSGKKGGKTKCIMHAFPSDKKKIKEWLLQTGDLFENIEETTTIIYDGKKTKTYRLCSSHFSEECYHIVGETCQLKPDALPTIFSKIPIIRDPNTKRLPKRTFDESQQSTSTCGSWKCHVEKKDVETQTTDFSVFTPSAIRSDSMSSHHSTFLGDHSYVAPSPPISTEKTLLSSSNSKSAKKRKTISVDQDCETVAVTEQVCSEISLDETRSQTSQISGALKFSPDFSANSQNTDSEDSDFIPEETSESDTDDRLVPPPEPNFAESIGADKKFLVFESCLDSLLYKVRCQANEDCLETVKSFKKYIEGIIHFYKRKMDIDSNYGRVNLELSDMQEEIF